MQRCLHGLQGRMQIYQSPAGARFQGNNETFVMVVILHVYMAAGSITHHEEVARLRKVYELVQDARQQVAGVHL